MPSIPPRAGINFPAGGLSCFSRDEMNLAEFPLTVLSTRVDPKVKTLEFSDHLRAKNGDLIERKWIITAADKFGLPTSTDDDVILGLIRLSMDEGFRERKIFFTRYELLRALRWSTEGRSYSRLTKSLDRLSGVRIRATNSFYDNTSKSYQTCNFGIIDAYEINDHRGKKGTTSAEPPKSFFIWSEMLFDSFKAGFIKKLDLELYFSLHSAVSRRLYRYLDKHFYFKSTLEKPLQLLAFEKLGLSRSYRYTSSIRQQLEPACEELVQKGFLASFEFVGRGENAAVRFTMGSGVNQGGSGVNQGALVRSRSVETLSHSQPAAFQPQPAERLYPPGKESRREVWSDTLIEALVSRGINVRQAKRLISLRKEHEAPVIDRIIQYYDCLVENNDPKVSRSKIGFLYRAVESPHKFTVPSSFGRSSGVSRNAAAAGRQTEEGRGVRPEHRILRSKAPENRERQNAAYRDAMNQAIGTEIKRLDGSRIVEMYSSVEKKMNSLRSVVSGEKFQEAVEHCVKDELIRELGLPDFQTWLAGQKE